MTWVPAIVLFVGGVLPIIYDTTTSDNLIFDTVSMRFISVAALLFAIPISFGASDSLVANPLLLGVTIVEVLVVIRFVFPIVISAVVSMAIKFIELVIELLSFLLE
jgi:hypothetical protein